MKLTAAHAIKDGWVRVKKGYGTVCDGMTGMVSAVSEADDSATVRFEGDGDVVLPLDSLEEI